MNIRQSQFLKERSLSRLFAPTATFHQDNKEQTEEFVSMMEGI